MLHQLKGSLPGAPIIVVCIVYLSKEVRPSKGSFCLFPSGIISDSSTCHLRGRRDCPDQPPRAQLGAQLRTLPWTPGGSLL